MEISIIPRFFIKRISDNDINQINWNILISSILILFSLLFIRLSLINSIPHFCLFERLAGLPQEIKITSFAIQLNKTIFY